jgi:hypothetical protein
VGESALCANGLKRNYSLWVKAHYAPTAVSFINVKLLTAAFGSPFLCALKVCCLPLVSDQESRNSGIICTWGHRLRRAGVIDNDIGQVAESLSSTK